MQGRKEGRCLLAYGGCIVKLCVCVDVHIGFGPPPPPTCLSMCVSAHPCCAARPPPPHPFSHHQQLPCPPPKKTKQDYDETALHLLCGSSSSSSSSLPALLQSLAQQSGLGAAFDARDVVGRTPLHAAAAAGNAGAVLALLSCSGGAMGGAGE